MIGERTVNSSLPYNFVSVNMYQCLKILQKRFILYIMSQNTSILFISLTININNNIQVQCMTASRACGLNAVIFCILISTQYLITLYNTITPYCISTWHICKIMVILQMNEKMQSASGRPGKTNDNLNNNFWKPVSVAKCH